MDQIGEHHHQFDSQFRPVDNISPAAFQSLDTVRALHQTVVSLRTALEAAHREIDTLKRQVTVTTDIRDGKTYHEQEDKSIINTIADDEPLISDAVTEASSLTSTIGIAENIVSAQQTTERRNRNDFIKNNNSIEQKDSVIFNLEETESQTAKTTKCHDDNKGKYENISSATPRSKRKLKASGTHSQRCVNVEEIRVIERVIGTKKPGTSNNKVITHPKHSIKNQMASKIDVKIRLSSDIKVNGSSSETSSDTNSGSDTPRDESIEKSDGENVDTPRSDPHDLQEPTDDTSTDIPIVDVANAEQTKENDGDDVFLANEEPSKKHLQAAQTKLKQNQSPRRSTSDNQEEVDDIELIFSSDDKEFTQDDLISISYYEPWQKCGKSGTPVLTNFASIGSDPEASVDDGDGCVGDESDMVDASCSPTDIDPDRFYNAIKQHVAQQNSLQSNDSLNYGDQIDRRGGGSTKESSAEKDSDNENRPDESFDKFDQANCSTLGRRWTNYNVLMETDISKCGIVEEGSAEMRRRNTCPNPPAYRPIIHREAMRRHNLGAPTANRCPLAVKFSRNARSQHGPNTRSPRQIVTDPNKDGPKRSSSAQTDISALPEHWRSESHLNGGILGSGFFTLPSKFVPPPGFGYHRCPLKLNKKTREARRVLLSDINFTSMVPELSRSADHLCQGEEQQNAENNNSSNANIATGSGDGGNNHYYYKGSHLKTPDYINRGITPSVSMTSPGVSQWTVNENSFGAQSTQTDWNAMHGDSFDSCKDFSMGSKYSASFGKHCRSRSCSSVRCHVCKHRNRDGIKMSESMHHTPLVTFTEPNRNKTRASLPDLRLECTCGCNRNRNARCSTSLRFCDSYASTESLIDEAEDFLCKSIDGVFTHDVENSGNKTVAAPNRRCSENDIKRDYSPSKQTLPFLPKSPKCLKPGHLAKVIAKNGRCVIGRVRYVGPLVSISNNADQSDNEAFIGLQLPNKIGDCDGSFENRKFFDCEPNFGMFVPFKKIVMAWTS